MAKKETEQVCPYCGGKTFLGTSEGILCKTCGKIINAFTLVLKEEKDN
jgi:ribosomal protein L37AE/L43A